MSILSDHSIKDLCENWQEFKLTGPLVDPYCEPHVNPASYDMMLGNEFVVFDAEQQVCIDLAYPISDGTSRKQVHADGEPFILQPLQFALGVTVEKVNMPHDIAGRLDGKSSLARAGLLIHLTGGNIDPGFCGPITLEMFNVRRCPIILHPGQPFCQLVFQMLTTPADNPYQGRYQHATGVEASKYGMDLDKVRTERLGRLVDPEALAKWAAEEGHEPPYKEKPGIVQPLFQDRPLKE
jgi:dCTP deaminase